MSLADVLTLQWISQYMVLFAILVHYEMAYVNAV